MSNRIKRAPQRPSRVHQQQQESARRRGLLAGLILGAAVIAAVIIAVVVAGGDDSSDGIDIAFNGVSLPAFDPGGSDLALGEHAPLFVTEDTAGTRVVTGGGGGPNDTAKVITFVSHWCPTCQAELPRAVEWLETHDLPDGVEVIVVSTLEDASKSNFPPDAWFTAEGLPMPALLDSSDGQIASMFGFSDVPSWVVLDNHNGVMRRATGGLTGKGFDALIDLAAAGDGGDDHH